MILLSDPGTPARQVHLPRAWPVLLGLLSAMSIGASLFIGRQARAWFEPSIAPAVAPMPEFLASMTRPPALSRMISTMPAQTMGAPPPPLLVPSSRPRREEITLVSAAAVAGPQRKTQPDLPVSSAQLRLFDVNGKRSLRVMPFAADGAPDAQAFGELKHFLRCRRSGQEMDMSPQLITVLLRISQHFEGAEIQVISGHRKPDGAVTRETSQHAFGTAADIRIAGVSVETLAEAAHQLGARGVGVYTRERFVHVDVRTKAYSWRDTGDETAIAP